MIALNNNWSLSSWQKPVWRRFTRIVSLLITLTFVFPYLTWAFERGTFLAGKHFIFFNHRAIEIPKELGAVIKSFQGKEALVVYIQDLHCNAEVQTNIANIIGHMADRHGLKLVGVEGASGRIDVGKLAGFPVKAVKEAVGKYFMQQGKIGGAEYYAAVGEHPIVLQGIEQAEYYAANRQSVKMFLNHESQGYVYDLRETLAELKNQVYGKELKAHDRHKTAFRKGEESLLNYCVFLYQAAGRAGLNLEPFPQLCAYISKRRNVFPKAVDSDGLFLEMERAETEIRAGLYQSEAGPELDGLEHRLDVMEKLVNISVSPGELADYRRNPEAFRVRVFLDFIGRYTAKEDLWLDPGVYKLDACLEEAGEFYRVADRRSISFVENTLEGMKQYQTRLGVLVTGGFHSDEVLSELQRQGISYVCVKPRLSRADLVNPYFSLLQDRDTPLEKLLAQNQKILALPILYQAGKSAAPEKIRAFSRWQGLMLKAVFLAYLIKGGAWKTGRLKDAYMNGIMMYSNSNPSIVPDWDARKESADERRMVIPWQNMEITTIVSLRGAIRLGKTLARLALEDYQIAMVDAETAGDMLAKAERSGRRFGGLLSALRLKWRNLVELLQSSDKPVAMEMTFWDKYLPQVPKALRPFLEELIFRAGPLVMIYGLGITSLPMAGGLALGFMGVFLWGHRGKGWTARQWGIAGAVTAVLSLGFFGLSLWTTPAAVIVSSWPQASQPLAGGFLGFALACLVHYGNNWVYKRTDKRWPELAISAAPKDDFKKILEELEISDKYIQNKIIKEYEQKDIETFKARVAQTIELIKWLEKTFGIPDDIKRNLIQTILRYPETELERALEMSEAFDEAIAAQDLEKILETLLRPAESYLPPLIEHPKDESKWQNWIAKHPEKPGYLRYFAEIILEKIKYISHTELEKKLEKTAINFNREMGDDEYIVFQPGEDKSNGWCYSQLVRNKVIKKAENIFFYKSNRLPAYLKDNKINHIVIIDDASFSGLQVRETIDIINQKLRTKSEKEKTEQLLNIHIVIPYMTNYAESKIQKSIDDISKKKNSPKFELHIHEFCKFKTVKEMLNEKHILKNKQYGRNIIGLFKNIYGNLYRGLIYFDHKTASTKSVLAIEKNTIFNGAVPKKEGNRYISDPEKKTPIMPEIIPPYHFDEYIIYLAKWIVEKGEMKKTIQQPLNLPGALGALLIVGMVMRPGGIGRQARTGPRLGAVFKAVENINWPRIKQRLLSLKFWTGLFTETIPRYPNPKKLDFRLQDTVKYILSFISITASFTLLSGSLITGLTVCFLIYFGLNEARNIYSEQRPHFGWDIRKWANKKYAYPAKHARAMFTSGIGTPIFALLSSVIFWVINPLSGWVWILFTTFLLANYGGVFDSYMRGRQYPEPDIRRAEYIRNYFITLLTASSVYYSREIIELSSLLPGQLQIIHALLIMLLVSNSIAYLIFRRVISELLHGHIDIKGGYKLFETAKELEVALPGGRIPVHQPEKSDVLIKRKRSFYYKFVRKLYELFKRRPGDEKENLNGERYYYDKWRLDREEAEQGLKKAKSIDELIERFNKNIGEKILYDLNKKKNMKQYAQSALVVAESRSLSDKAMKEMSKQKIFNDTMLNLHKREREKYDELIGQYGSEREKFTIACYLTKPLEEEWEKVLEFKQFEKRPIEVIILDKDEAGQAGLEQEKIDYGVFGDSDTGCIIIINKEWNQLELLMRIQKARAKMEIFSKTMDVFDKDTSERLKELDASLKELKQDKKRNIIKKMRIRRLEKAIEHEETRKQEFGRHLVAYHNQWYKYKEDDWHRQIRPVMEGLQQELMFKYMHEFFEKHCISTKLLHELKQYYAFPEKLPQGLFIREEVNNYVLYNFVLGFIEFAGLKNIRNNGSTREVAPQEYLEALLYHYGSQPDLSQNIWRAITKFSKKQWGEKETPLRTRAIDWFDAKLLNPWFVLITTTAVLIGLLCFGHWPLVQEYFKSFALSNLLAGLGLASTGIMPAVLAINKTMRKKDEKAVSRGGQGDKGTKMDRASEVTLTSETRRMLGDLFTGLYLSHKELKEIDFKLSSFMPGNARAGVNEKADASMLSHEGQLYLEEADRDRLWQEAKKTGGKVAEDEAGKNIFHPIISLISIASGKLEGHFGIKAAYDTAEKLIGTRRVINSLASIDNAKGRKRRRRLENLIREVKTACEYLIRTKDNRCLTNKQITAIINGLEINGEIYYLKDKWKELMNDKLVKEYDGVMIKEDRKPWFDILLEVSIPTIIFSVIFSSIFNSPQWNRYVWLGMGTVAGLGWYVFNQASKAFFLKKKVRLANILKNPDYKKSFADSSRIRKTWKSLSGLGISGDWDEGYAVSFNTEEQAEANLQKIVEMTRGTIKELLGKEVTGEEVGKKRKYTVKAKILRKKGFNAADVRNDLGPQGWDAIIKGDGVTKDDCIKMLHELKKYYVNKDGKKELEQIIEELQRLAQPYFAGKVEFEIRERNPYTYLRHKDIFRDVQYIENKGIILGDFEDAQTHKTLVTAVMGACLCNGESILLVDHFEGDEKLLAWRIEDNIFQFAKAHGFKYIIYNEKAMPKKLVDNVSKIAARKTLYMELADTSEKIWLSAFGSKRKIPRGKVTGYVIDVESMGVDAETWINQIRKKMEYPGNPKAHEPGFDGSETLTEARPNEPLRGRRSPGQRLALALLSACLHVSDVRRAGNVSVRLPLDGMAGFFRASLLLTLGALLLWFMTQPSAKGVEAEVDTQLRELLIENYPDESGVTAAAKGYGDFLKIHENAVFIPLSSLNIFKRMVSPWGRVETAENGRLIFFLPDSLLRKSGVESGQRFRGLLRHLVLGYLLKKHFARTRVDTLMEGISIRHTWWKRAIHWLWMAIDSRSYLSTVIQPEESRLAAALFAGDLKKFYKNPQALARAMLEKIANQSNTDEQARCIATMSKLCVRMPRLAGVQVGEWRLKEAGVKEIVLPGILGLPENRKALKKLRKILQSLPGIILDRRKLGPRRCPFIRMPASSA